MKNLTRNNEGYVMVAALAFIAALALLAGIIVAVATTEKKTTFNEEIYNGAFYSAEAGSETAINWLRYRSLPPMRLDPAGNVFVPDSYTDLTQKARYKYDVQYSGKRLRPGWSTEFKDFQYTIESDGAGVQESEAEVRVLALRLFKEGY